MIEYLEDRAPCIYIPNYDVGHSGISPKLSERVAIVGIVHSDDPQHYEHVLRLGQYWNAIVAVSATIAHEVSKRAPNLSKRLSVIPYGIAAAEVLTDRRRPAAAPLRVVYAGRIDQPQKRVLDIPGILQAAAALGTPTHLTVAGSGPAEAQLRSLCAAAGASVEFLGTLNGDTLAEVLAGQDVFLLPSAFEGLPIGVLEAMGQGCIPVVTDVRSGIPEVIADRENGFRVAAGDVAGFAACLAEIHRNPGMRRQMAESAYRTARSGCYRLDSMVQSYIDLFERVLQDARRGNFRRPGGDVLPPRDLPWQEYLPAPIQRAGHYGRRLLASPRT
jgi:glycosyltransferase involved in cell wall biosynthesis